MLSRLSKTRKVLLIILIALMPIGIKAINIIKRTLRVLDNLLSIEFYCIHHPDIKKRARLDLALFKLLIHVRRKVLTNREMRR